MLCIFFPGLDKNVNYYYYNYRKGEWLTIPKGWLCYLAPEVIRSLKAGSRQENDNLPFSRASDIYAFGYEFHFILLF